MSGSESLRVLVIDDHKTMRSILRQLLGKVGIDRVDEAENGREALERLLDPAVKDPDVIICDLHMDEMDGIEFCNRLRRCEKTRERVIPILILTGDHDELLHEVTRQVGAATVLTKPISGPELRRHIERAIGFEL